MSRRLQFGFTLIELLVVVAILGILMSLVMVTLHSAQEKARDSQRKTFIGQMRSGLLVYEAEKSSFPDTGGNWWSRCTANGAHGVTGAGGTFLN